MSKHDQEPTDRYAAVGRIRQADVKEEIRPGQKRSAQIRLQTKGAIWKEIDTLYISISILQAP
ncbi:hypothetical protein BPOR_0757g00020 [Botrytis porri]|uniref:Uncharacterized protein n=1 Tax=Botrytis porri TaxID=87229 RepID=A0A4Z1KBL6_9HELO|nr:hypothetical protein BPOR_0757g00020 [Botrytis porri]